MSSKTITTTGASTRNLPRFLVTLHGEVGRHLPESARIVVALDMRRGFSEAELEAIDRDCERQRVSRGEFVANAIKNGLERHREAGEVRVQHDKRTVATDLPVETYVALRKLGAVDGRSVETVALEILTKTAGTVELTADDFSDCADLVRQSESFNAATP